MVVPTTVQSARGANSFIHFPFNQAGTTTPTWKAPFESQTQKDVKMWNFTIWRNRSALTRSLLPSSVCQPVFQLISERLFTLKKEKKKENPQKVEKVKPPPSSPPRPCFLCNRHPLPPATLSPLAPTHRPSVLPPFYSLLSEGGCQIALAFLAGLPDRQTDGRTDWQTDRQGRSQKKQLSWKRPTKRVGFVRAVTERQKIKKKIKKHFKKFIAS